MIDDQNGTTTKDSTVQAKLYGFHCNQKVNTKQREATEKVERERLAEQERSKV